MNRLWSILFLLVPVVGVGWFIWAYVNHMWLVKDVSEQGWRIDHLYYFILYLTGVVFVITEVLLFFFMWKYDADHTKEPVKFTHGSHTLEIVWTIIPAATLLFIAIYQMNAWAKTKMETPNEGKPNRNVTIEVQARQFEWRLRYPNPRGDGKLAKMPRPDDVWTVNELHVPVDEDILISLKTQDVLHSFFLPNLRVKQDAVPGMTIPVWFKAKEMGRFDIPCAELCGWGHYKMKGQLVVESRQDYEAWLTKLYQEQTRTQFEETK